MRVLRYILDNGGPLWMTDIAAALRAHFGPRGYAVPRLTAPYILVALFALWDKDAAAVRKSIGLKVASFNPAKASALLGGLRSFETSLVDMGESLVEAGLVAPRGASSKNVERVEVKTATTT